MARSFDGEAGCRKGLDSELPWYGYAWADLVGMAAACLFVWIFYHRIWPGLLAVAGILPYHHLVQIIWKRYKERQMRRQFRDALQMLQGYLQAGRSLENAMVQTKGRLQAEQAQSHLAAEWNQMVMQMEHNLPVEQAWEAFAVRCPLPEVQQFAEVLSVAKRSGGSLVQVIQAAVHEITLLMQTEEEVGAILAARKMQLYVMEGIPVLLIAYLNLSSPDLLAQMYDTGFGNLVMTGCLVVYGVAVWIGWRISHITV